MLPINFGRIKMSNTVKTIMMILIGTYFILLGIHIRNNIIADRESSYLQGCNDTGASIQWCLNNIKNWKH
jgi:hypothetical protein